MAMMKKIGLFGGTFDPVHLGHMHIAQAFADELELDMVVFLPAGDPYHKHAPVASATHRLAMAQLATAGDERFAVSDCDMVRDGPTYTFDTVQIFRQQFPSARLHWLLGMDSLLQLHTWRRWQALVRQIGVAVAARAGDNLNQAPPALHGWIGEALQSGDLHILKAPLSSISSTDIRQRIRQSQSLEGLVQAEVADYIRQHRLYR